MAAGWISLDEVARQRAISLEEAQDLAIRMRWPCIFRLHETLVLPGLSAS
ncbi:hypothetical protein [Methylobacterium sp. Leaf108]|nr:hypothetical protein [Methylobacterium sp. Leaf108]